MHAKHLNHLSVFRFFTDFKLVILQLLQVVTQNPPTKMVEKKLVCKVICKVNLFFLLFIVFVVFYMYDEMSDFLKERTTISTRFDKADVSDFPTITICMSNSLKTSVAKKYGMAFTTDSWNENILNRTVLRNMSEIQNQLSYILNRDFEIILAGNGQTILNEGRNKKWHYEIDVKPILTMYLTCYKIQVQFNRTGSLIDLPLSITFRLIQTVEDPEDVSKGIEVLLTSSNTWFGITHSWWPQFKPTIIKVPFDSGIHDLKITTVEHRYKEGMDEVDDTKDCMTKVLSGANCSVICDPFNLGNFPDCQYPKESVCMGMWLIKEANKWSECITYKKVLTYHVSHGISRNHTVTSSIGPSKMVVVSMTLDSPKKQINEEIWIITGSNLIASLGGSVGMFFGFSLFSPLVYFFEKIIDRLFDLASRYTDKTENQGLESYAPPRATDLDLEWSRSANVVNLDRYTENGQGVVRSKRILLRLESKQKSDIRKIKRKIRPQ